MSLRVRYTAAISAITLVTLGGAFAAVSQAVNASQERQLDLALVHEAREEAAEADALGGDELAISGRPGPAANDVGPLTKYAIIYDRAGAVIDQTPSWRRHPPARASLPAPGSPCFDLYSEEEHLRAVHVDLLAHPGVSLLLAAPRTDLDGDARFLARAMATAFGIAALWTVLVALVVVGRLTRAHRMIADVARRVAGGDLDARIRLQRGSSEVVQLARDLDAMIDRLGLLLGHQQRFIANAAHELRSPLTTLYGELSHALRRSREPAEYERAIREALDSTARLRRMAEDLLAVARMGADGDGPTEPVMLAEVTEEAIALVRAEADRAGVAIVREGPDARLLARPPDLVRLVRNLLENAIRHSPPRGRVTLRARATAEHVELRVIDEGHGVAPAERERIFEAFYRGAPERAAGGGTGLGLTIAREIARAHGGEVHLEPGDGPGTTFTITLPRA